MELYSSASQSSLSRETLEGAASWAGLRVMNRWEAFSFDTLRDARGGLIPSFRGGPISSVDAAARHFAPAAWIQRRRKLRDSESIEAPVERWAVTRQ